MEALIKEWNAANPDMPAVLEVQPEGAYNEQVQAAAASGGLPDLLDFDGPNYANYVWSGYLQPLNGLVSDATIADVIPSLIAQGKYAPDGKHVTGNGGWCWGITKGSKNAASTGKLLDFFMST